MRPVNEILESIRRWKGLSYADMARLMEGGYTEESTKWHFINDSGNGFTISRMIEILFAEPLPTLPSKDFATGEVNARVRRELEIRGWTVRELTRRALKESNETDPERLHERLRKFFEDKSVNSYLVALICTVYGWPTVEPDAFLRPEEQVKAKKPKQLKLRFGQVA